MWKRGAALVIFLSALQIQVFSQLQLVFFENGQVAYRFTEGSDFKCILKNRQRKEGFIVELHEFFMITSNDTIEFQSILKIDKGGRGINVMSGIGGLLFVGGLGYIAIDQINGALGYSPKGWDTSDQRALIVAGVGALILFTKSKYQRVEGMMIRVIDYKSPYYLN